MKRKLSDVLWTAANTRLSHTDDADWSKRRFSFSCDAVGELLPVAQRTGSGNAYKHSAFDFLRALGCETSHMYAFHEFPAGMERQGARYMWLLLAACVAEDEGITV
jgi:hypothetical protein